MIIMVKTTTLNKTNYLLGARCPKALQLKLQHPELSSEYGKEADFSELEELYDLSKEYYPDCVVINNDEGLARAILETQIAIEDGKETIANAMFRTTSNETCRVRLMHKNKDGAYDIFDIQSKQAEDESKLSKDGIAYIYQVLKRCGVSMGSLFIMHINSSFVKEGPIEAREYFSLYDCTTEVYEMQPTVLSNIELCWKVINATEEVEKERDFTCIQPKDDACEFSCHCFKDIPENSILNITRFQAKKALPLIDKGIVTMKDLVESGEKYTENQRLQVETEAYNLPPTVDIINLERTLGTITYPLYHLDFETINEPVPHFDGEKPWQQVPFQFSLHVQHYKGEEPEHYEFLAEPGTDYRRAIAEALCEYIPADACTLAYHMSFEQGRLTELAELYDDLHDHLISIRDNMQDLEVPFSKHYYYCKAMEGKSSIKKVLPALCPGDPELDYSTLEGVHKGDEASKAFKDMAHMSKEDAAVTRRQLLDYCCLDTLAMVRVLDRLYEILDRELDRAA